MAFHEVRFPTNLSYGTVGGPGYNTNIIVLDSGHEERVARWENAKRRYNVAYAIKSRSDLTAVLEFYIARMGPAYGFRFKDFLDFTTASDHISAHTANDHEIGVGDGSVTRFRLRKSYLSGSSQKIRYLTKPVAGSVRVALDGVEQGVGWTVDTTTGEVIFGVAPGTGVSVTAGCEFDVPVRFGKEVDENALRAGLDDFGHGHVEEIPLVEIPEGLDLEGYPPTSGGGDTFCGTAVEVCMTADYVLSPGIARAYVFDATVAGLSVILPNPSNVPPGGPVFWLLNVGPEDIDVDTHDGTTLATLAAGEAAVLILAEDGAEASEWYLV